MDNLTINSAEWLVLFFAMLLLAIPVLIVFIIIKKVMRNDQRLKALQKELDELKNERNL